MKFFNYILLFPILALPVYPASLSGRKISSTLAALKQRLARDTARETVFKVKAFYLDGFIYIKGRVLTRRQKTAVETAFRKMGKVYSLLQCFPYREVGKKSYFIINKPYINLYVKPKRIAGKNLATQALLGMSGRILERNKHFLKIKLDHDGYICWAYRKGVIECTRPVRQKWNRGKKVIITNNNYSPRLYFTTKLPLTKAGKNNYRVRLPDSGIAWITRKTAMPFQGKTNPAGARKYLVKTASLFLPGRLLSRGRTHYLWGGTKGSRLDCSGFTQTVYRAHGYSLPRDADQQQRYLLPVAPNLAQISGLKPGDLVFFGKGKNATHTGIYIGRGFFIHSSSRNKGVAVNSFKGHSAYERLLRRRYIGGGRLKELP